MDPGLLFGMGITALATIMGSIGALLFKKSSNHLGGGIFTLLKKPAFYIGFILYGLSALMFVYALRFGDLSALYPVGGLNYIWVSLLSIKYLGESMNKYKWLGVFLIILGVVFIGVGS